MRTPFLQELEKRVLVCDGAMGTMLYAKGIFLNRSFDELNLTQPDLVAEAERSELDAVRAERVRLDDVRARADVLLMHFSNQVRLRHVERVEALVDEDALRVQHRPHRAVAHEDAFSERIQKRLQHLPTHQLQVSSLSVLNVSASTSKYDFVTTSRPIERTLCRIESVNS